MFNWLEAGKCLDRIIADMQGPQSIVPAGTNPLAIKIALANAEKWKGSIGRPGLGDDTGEIRRTYHRLSSIILSLSDGMLRQPANHWLFQRAYLEIQIYTRLIQSLNTP